MRQLQVKMTRGIASLIIDFYSFPSFLLFTDFFPGRGDTTSSLALNSDGIGYAGISSKDFRLRQVRS